MMKLEDYFEKFKKKRNVSGLNDVKKSIQSGVVGQDVDDIRDPINLPDWIKNTTEIDARFVEGYLIEVVKRNKISVNVGRLLKEWYSEKSSLSSIYKETNDLEVSLEDLELLLSRMDKVEKGTVEITNS